MKSLAFFALSVVATAAMATQPTGPSTLTISGNSTQLASVNGGYLTNTAHASAYANQNVASNKGDIDIKGNSSQTAILQNAKVSNEAKSAGDVAVQNLASNAGDVNVDKSHWVTGSSTQSVTIIDGTMRNEANSSNGCYGSNCADAAMAFQNAASNMGDISISGTSVQTVGVSGANTLVSNKADGKNTAAIQNMSSNYGKVAISGYSSQTTAIAGGATVANLATGSHAVAIQNIASNDSCDPPPAVCVGPFCGPFSHH
jgi:hypothetical protein